MCLFHLTRTSILGHPEPHEYILHRLVRNRNFRTPEISVLEFCPSQNALSDYAASNALGAQLAYPGRQTIATCGDGGFTMLALGDRYGAGGWTW